MLGGSRYHELAQDEPGRMFMRGTSLFLKALVALVCLAVFAWWGVWLPLHASGYDFTGPYEAAYTLGHHANFPIYDVSAQREFSARVLHLPDGPSDFRWTPPMAVLLIPLGLLPYGVARVIWWALGVGALLASLSLLARCVAATRRQGTLGRRQGERAGGDTWRAFAVLCGAAALAQPVTDSLRLGQSTPLLLLGFALLVYGEVFDRQVWSGLGLALAILDKLFPAALLIYLLWRGRYRACGVALGALALLCVATLPVTGLGLYSAFGRALLAFSSEPNGGPVNLSLYHALVVGAAALLQPGQAEPRGGPLVALAALMCVALFGVAVAAGSWPAALKRAPRSSDLMGGAGEQAGGRFFWVSWAVTALLALEPVDWVFYYLLLLVPLAWLLSGPEAGRRMIWRLPAARWRLLAWLALALALAPLPLDSRTTAPMTALYVAGIAARPLGLLGLWLAHALFALDAREAARAAPTEAQRHA
jgi:hypothetical protein